MAEQIVYSMASAVTGELTSRVFSGLIQMFGKQAAVGEKLQRLEMLLIKIQSVVEASDKRTIKNLWLLRWHDKLKEATSQGDEVLASFTRQAEIAEATRRADTNQQQDSSSSYIAASATGTGVISFTSKSMWGMAQGIGDVTQMLFSSDEDMAKLNSTLSRLEQLSVDIKEFITLFQLEAWAEVEHQPRKKMRTHVELTPKELPRRMKRNCSGFKLFGFKADTEENREISAPCVAEAVVNKSMHLSVNETVVIQKEQHAMLLDRLEEAFVHICKTVELADSYDFEHMEWLAYWADILREAKIRGCVVLSAISSRKKLSAKDKEESMVECDQEKDEFRSFVHSMEGLARDVECFSKLVYLCS